MDPKASYKNAFWKKGIVLGSSITDNNAMITISPGTMNKDRNKFVTQCFESFSLSALGKIMTLS